MKGILNKFKGLGSSPGKKPSTKQSEAPSEEGVPVEEGQKPAGKFSFFPSKKIASKTRHQIVKDYLNSTKFYKLLQALEKEGETDHEGSTSHNVYFKENVKSMAAVLKEKLQCLEEVDLASREVAKLYRSYQNVSIKDETPLFCISVISQQTEAPTLEYVYPDFKEKLNLDDEITNFLSQSLKDLGIPDASKNSLKEDFVYFIIDVNRKKFEKLEAEALQKLSKDISNDHAVLYGISFSKQIPVAETGTVQKAVCILSRVPLFGHILAKLDPVTKCYLLQENHKDTQILTNFYDNINSSLKEITINLSELLAGTCTKKLVYFLKSKLMTLWKALFLEKRVLIFSQSPGACSSFIHSLLALYPCLCHFKYHSKALNSIENHYSEYGLPLRFFHEDCPLVPYLKADGIELINSAKGFLAGTSKNLTNVNWDILVDIDKNAIQFKNDAVKKALNLTKQDKEFIQNILKKVTSNNSAESLSWSNIESSIFNDVDLGLKGSEEWIRNKFYDYLKNFLTELEFFAYGASAGKLDSHIEDFNAYLTNKGQTEGETFDWKDEILSPEDETGSRKDGDETEDEEIGSPMSGRSKSSKGKRAPQAMSQDDLDDFVQRTSQIDIEEKKTGEEKEVKEPRRWFRSPLKRDSKPSGDVKSPQDAKTVLKKELLPLKDSLKMLKKYGIDWILGWTRTSNFECWLDAHLKMIGERSQDYRYAKNHVWCMENGDIYLGELRFGQKTGTGQFIDRQAKAVYSGDWEEDERSGTGKLVSLETGETIYEGNFSGNKRHGAGKSTQNNEKYTGAFNMEKYEGHGTLVDKDKNTYEGEFKEGCKWGMGKLQLANGDLYTGEFVKDKYHGKGQLVCKNGDFYSGEFQDGLKWGRGILQKASGDTYEGQFWNDVYEGHGKLTKKDGHAFEGAFKGGHFSSTERGFIHYPDGAEYMGEINDYKAHGYGTMTRFEGNQEIVCYGIFDSDQLIEEISKVTVDQKDPDNVQKVEGEEPK